MSVWPQAVPQPSLEGPEGTLVCLSIDVESRDLEDLLETLARVEFPINPQIYHDAEIVYIDAAGREEAKPSTLVEFPAYAARIDEVRRALDGGGFGRTRIRVTSMLEELHADPVLEPAPPGASYVSQYRRKWSILQAKSEHL